MTSIVVPDSEGLTHARAFAASRVKAELTEQDRKDLIRINNVYGPFDPSLTAMTAALLQP